MAHKKPRTSPNLLACEKRIGYRFRNRNLLALALTHRSFIHESGGPLGPDNDRLEFLGDSVLGLIIAEMAYRQSPDYSEGDLTEIRSGLVNRETLAKKAVRIKLGSFMSVGKGQVRSGKLPETIASCGIEAVIGAIYLDRGLGAAARFIQRHIWSRQTRKPRAQAPSVTRNYKEQLQKLFLDRYGELPKYVVIKETGPSHHRQFTLGIKHRKRVLAKGEGLSKKKASQQAARQALQKLKKRPRRRKTS